MYVGITRAQRTLAVSWTRGARRAARLVAAQPSRFIAEMALDATLGERLRGKVFQVALADGGWWRLEYRDKQWYINTNRGFSDDGPWHVEGSNLCSEGRRIKAACYPMRLAGGVLLMKRDNGEVVKFEPR
jgi:hypothetical protein